MKKIIAAFDGLKYSESTQDYAIYLSRLSNAHLVGVFLEDAAYTSYKIYELVGKEGVSESRLKKLEEKDNSTRHESVERFEKSCQHWGLEFSIHHDKNMAVRELKHESIFADLLVINVAETLSHHPEKIPTWFIEELLGDAHCPVLLVPDVYKPIEKIVLLYDGEPGAVRAIKMFSYLLPQLKKADTEVIAINPPDTSLHLPDNRLMKELMKRHFPQAKFNVSVGLPEDEIIKRLKGLHANSLVVLGAPKRSLIVRWCTESFGDILMKGVKLPLFIVR
jgi:hypothetical protein